MKPLNWKLQNPNDLKYIEQIADAVVEFCQRKAPHLVKPSLKREIIMDLNAAQSNGCPLYLATMASRGADFDVLHDVFGIRKNLNRETGQMENCFWPRFAES